MGTKTKNLLIAVLLLVAIVLIVSFVKYPVIKETTIFNVPKICVHIKGAVHSPGLYELDASARVNDAIIIAGGALDTADLNAVNLARFLEDGEELIIPGANGKTKIYDAVAININTADVGTLGKLDGIGETTAKNIVEYRNLQGKFEVKEEIMNVPGIGASLFERIKNKICVD